MVESELVTIAGLKMIELFIGVLDIKLNKNYCIEKGSLQLPIVVIVNFL